MQKSKLDKFIQKYNLGGNINSVKWKSNGDSLSTSFISADKSLLGSVKVDNFNFDSSEIGVYQTDILQKMLGALGDDVNLSLTKAGDIPVSLNVKNGSVSLDYVLSDLSVIPDAPALKRIPDFGTKIKLDNHFINTFIKGKSALSDTDSFTLRANKTGGCDIIIGYSQTNTNRINIPVECETCDVSSPITFNANLFKELLLANRECSTALFEVSTDGLAKINFKVDDYDSTYYIVALQDVD